MGETGAIILAAGLGSRFGQAREETKLIADLDGKPLVRYVVEAALASSARPVEVVTGHAADKVLSALAGLDFVTVHNQAYAGGLSGSLKAGIAALPPQVRGAVILLADMPFVRAEVIDRLIACFDTASHAPDAAVPVRAGQRGNPVLIGRRLFPEIAKLEGDHGASGLLRQAGRRVIECQINDPAIEIDVDTREALLGLNRLP